MDSTGIYQAHRNEKNFKQISKKVLNAKALLKIPSKSSVANIVKSTTPSMASTKPQQHESPKQLDIKVSKHDESLQP